MYCQRAKFSYDKFSYDLSSVFFVLEYCYTHIHTHVHTEWIDVDALLP